MKKAWGLKAKDYIKGAVIAVGTPVLYLLQEMIPNWPLSPIEKAALSALATYLIKNFFTDDVKAAEKTLSKTAEKR
jgi:hypothetical protein